MRKKMLLKVVSHYEGIAFEMFDLKIFFIAISEINVFITVFIAA